MPGSDEELVRLALDDNRWCEFVSKRPDATVFHDPAWAAFLADCYGYRAFALTELEGGHVVAGAPIVEVRSPLGARRWVSLPFSDECGPLAGSDPVAFVTQLDRARRNAGVGSLELRADVQGGIARPRGVSHHLALEGDRETLMKNYRSSIRQGIRAAARAGVTVRLADERTDLTRLFYDLHVATRRRLGVPVQRRRYFELLWDRLVAREHGFVLVAELDKTPLAAAVFLHTASGVVYKYGASDARHWSLRANNALFHEAIGRSVEHGFTRFDWGRTDLADEGLRRFKTSWGAIEEPLSYTTLGAAPDAERKGRATGLAALVIRKSPAAVCRLVGALAYRYAA